MKKGIIALLFAALVLAGCSPKAPDTISKDVVSKAEYDAVVAERDQLKEQLASSGIPAEAAPKTEQSDTPAKSDKQSSDSFDEDTVASQIGVEYYSYKSSIDDYRAVVVLTNNSAFNISGQVNSILKNNEGATVTADTKSIKAFESGQELAFLVIAEEEFATLDTEFSLEEESQYSCVQSSLSLSTNTSGKKAVTEVKNIGDTAAMFAECSFLFFKDDELVSYDTAYAIDKDSEIKPGKTEYAEGTCYSKYDTVKVYITARGDS